VDVAVPQVPPPRLVIAADREAHGLRQLEAQHVQASRAPLDPSEQLAVRIPEA
jgi:hypothetical protein